MLTNWQTVPRDPIADDDELEDLYQLMERQAPTCKTDAPASAPTSDATLVRSYTRHKPPLTVASNCELSKLA